MNAFDMMVKLIELPLTEMVGDIVSGNKHLLSVYNQFQLSAGRDSTGGYLPRYIDDPYFSSIAEALNYQDWKSKISTNSEKPEDVMDFRINGQFHSTIRADVMGENIRLYSDSHIAADVMAKTGGLALGINPQSAAEYWQAIIYPLLVNGIKTMISSED